MDCDVLIVGAGASGLMAARELGRAGKKVIILEARDRIGGRIYPLSDPAFGYTAQGGAEFVHGEAPLTKALIAEAGLTTNHLVEWWDVRDGEPELIGHGSHIDKLSAHDTLIEAKLKELKEDMTVAQFLDTYFSAPEYESLRYITTQRIEGYDAADPARASALAMQAEMTDETGWQQQNIKEGYGALLAYLVGQCKAAGVSIELNKTVTAIDYSGEQVAVRCTDGSTYTSAQVVVTVPLPLIKTIAYTPATPEHLNAIDDIGFGSVIKLLLHFKHKWWSGAREQNFERMFFMFSNEAIPTWWTQYPEPRPTLTGWVAGPPAHALADTSEAQLLELALESLHNIFKISTDELRELLVTSKIINWAKDPLAQGAYSYSTPGTPAAIETLKQPVANKLYFAGEAIGGSEVTGTVEAALQSGRDTARAIIG